MQDARTTADVGHTGLTKRADALLAALAGGAK